MKYNDPTGNVAKKKTGSKGNYSNKKGSRSETETRRGKTRENTRSHRRSQVERIGGMDVWMGRRKSTGSMNGSGVAATKNKPRTSTDDNALAFVGTPPVTTAPRTTSRMSAVAAAAAIVTYVHNITKDSQERVQRSIDEAIKELEDLDPKFYYRGLSSIDRQEYETNGYILSKAVRAGLNPSEIINSDDFSYLAGRHSRSSNNPPSPFISVTTDPIVAIDFATVGRTTGNAIAIVGTERAKPNPHNQGQSEFLIPTLITSAEIIEVIYLKERE